jgi:hypothetical protein
VSKKTKLLQLATAHLLASLYYVLVRGEHNSPSGLLIAPRESVSCAANTKGAVKCDDLVLLFIGMIEGIVNSCAEAIRKEASESV